jgi:hypothetical protein
MMFPADPRDPTNPRGPLTPDDEARSPAGLGPGDSLSPLSPLPPRRVPAAEVKVRQVGPPAVHPAVKYAVAGGGWLGFIGSLFYIWYLVTHGGTRP